MKAKEEWMRIKVQAAEGRNRAGSGTQQNMARLTQARGCSKKSSNSQVSVLFVGGGISRLATRKIHA